MSDGFIECDTQHCMPEAVFDGIHAVPLGCSRGFVGCVHPTYQIVLSTLRFRLVYFII